MGNAEAIKNIKGLFLIYSTSYDILIHLLQLFPSVKHNKGNIFFFLMQELSY